MKWHTSICLFIHEAQCKRTKYIRISVFYIQILVWCPPVNKALEEHVLQEIVNLHFHEFPTFYNNGRKKLKEQSSRIQGSPAKSKFGDEVL